MSGELADLFIPHHSAGGPPRPGPGHGAPHVGEGVLVEWNPNTFQNVVRFHGTELRDLPVVAGISALAFAPGDIVEVRYWAPQGGAGVYEIGPQRIHPGSGAAQRAIAAMQTNLARQVAADILAARIHHAFVSDAVVLSDQVEFGDLPGSPGPEIADVEVTSGTALVFLSAGITCTVPTGAGSRHGYMGVEVSGATVVPPGDSLHAGLTNHNDQGVNQTMSARATSVTAVTGLTPGRHTFTAKYRNSPNTSALFAARAMVVIAL